MRPLTIRISGLRSYRSEQTIDFSEAGLLAIVGDTGAGKSSILEALFFALYGGCTWDHRAVVPLISDGCDVMQVEVTFIAETRRWRVFRSASRKAAQSRHELSCIDEPTIRYDNDGPVTAEIQRLIGLDRDAFLRAVILPQGRFQALLQATKGDRTAILKGIFRLDQLEAVREQADGASRRVRPAVDAIRLQRAALLPDPSAALAHATQRFEESTTSRDRLLSLSQALTDAKAKKRLLDQRLAELGAIESRLHDALVPTASAELAGLAALAQRFHGERCELDGQRIASDSTVTALVESLKRAEEDGQGIQALAAASSTVASLLDQLPALDAESKDCVEESAALDSLVQALQTRESSLAALRDRVIEADARSNDASLIVDAMNGALNRAKQELETARRRDSELAQLREEAKTAVARVAAAEDARNAASAIANETRLRLDAARVALEDIQRADAAAHAAQGCASGDPCPICERALPAGFTPPSAPGDNEAREKVQLLESEAAQATQAMATSVANCESAIREEARAHARVEAGHLALAASLEALASLIPDAELSADDNTTLAPLAEAAATARLQHKVLQDDAARLRNDFAVASAEFEASRADIRRRQVQLQRRQEALADRRRTCQAAVAGLPPRYRSRATLTLDDLLEIQERIDIERANLDGLSLRLAAARTSSEDLSRRLQQLAEQQRVEVELPVNRLMPKLAVVAERLDDLAEHLAAPRAPRHLEGSLSDAAAWADHLQAEALALLEAASLARRHLTEQRQEASNRIVGTLAGASVEDEPGLTKAVIEATAAAALAQDDMRVAQEQLPLAAKLDEQVLRGAELLGVLDELARLLSDGNFIGYVVGRKQQALLAVASEVLGSMTAARYGFSEAFEIIDRLTGLPRGVKTLSGGETFLASLALALALVELAGRGGGRLDALFLDEGFGSLDANSLAEALDALGRQAEAGKLVAVISHLRSVAENMDRVLAISLCPEGSRVHWLGGEERDHLLAEDVQAGLLS